MQKVRLVAYRDDADRLLDVLQRAGALELTEPTLTERTEPALAFPHRGLLPRIQHAVAFLEPYAPSRGLWRTLREGSLIPLSEERVRKQLENADVVSAVVDEVEQVQVEYAEAAERVRVLEERAAALKPWRELSIPLARFSTAYTRTFLVERASGESDTFSERLAAALADASVVHELTVVDVDHCTVTTAASTSTEALTSAVEQVGGAVAPTPEGEGTIAEALATTEQELAHAQAERGRLHDLAEHTAITHLQTLKVASEVYRWQRERFDAIAQGAALNYMVVFFPSLDSTKRVQVESAIEREGIAAALTEVSPVDGEEPPVEIKNHPLIEPFEAVTRLYGMPGYRELDPTLFLAGFFFLFFGLSLTDVGYGLFLVAVSAAVLFLFKVSRGVQLFAKLLLMTGIATVLVGLLFGGYLGIEPSQLPAALQAVQVFDPIGDPLPVFYLALGLGVVQVMVGMLLKIYSEARQGNTLGGVLDQGPWLLMFGLGIFYLATTLGYVTLLSTEQIVPLFYLGIVFIVLASGRTGKTVLDMVRLSLLSLYESIGYFSDILSYSRLLALGLATTALAFAVNLIAEIVRESVPYIGTIFALLILVIGHLFTLAVNTLGAFIHSARLQFVEFFGKFIAGTGREFKPLARSEQYVTVTDD